MSSRRLFFALWPNDRQRDAMRNIISPVATSVEGSAVYRGSWHVTLAFVGDCPEEKIADIQAVYRAVKFEPFRTRFDKAEFWIRPKIAILTSQSVPSELKHLNLTLETLLENVGFAPELKTYRPHITIVKRARPFETQRLAQAALVKPHCCAR